MGFSRTKTGCLTCRSRKKKCDELKPRCAGCRRNELDCDWPATMCIDQAGNSESPVGLIVEQTTPLSSNSGTQAPIKVSYSLPTLHKDSERACALTPQSALLLEHYISETVSCFAMTALKDNPFITLFLPIGYTDDLLMHALLAVSGAHMTYKNPNNTALTKATRLHYLRLVTSLRRQIGSLQKRDPHETLRLLHISLMAALHEIVSGNTRSVAFHHLHASAYLIEALGSQKSTSEPFSFNDLRPVCFSVELYMYLVINNTITPYDALENRCPPIAASTTLLNSMMTLPTSGAFFAGSHELCLIIPAVSRLAYRRLTEEAAGALTPSEPLQEAHDTIYNRVTAWTMPPLQDGESAEHWEAGRNAAEAFRLGICICLTTALQGSIVSDPGVKNDIFRPAALLFWHVRQQVATQRWATMLWPVMIAGSCLTKPEHQQAVTDQMMEGPWTTQHVDRIGEALQLLWDDPDPRAYEPYGLYLTMQKHGLDIALA